MPLEGTSYDQPVAIHRLNPRGEMGEIFDYSEEYDGPFGKVRLTRCGITEFGVSLAKERFRASMSRVIDRQVSLEAAPVKTVLSGEEE